MDSQNDYLVHSFDLMQNGVLLPFCQAKSNQISHIARNSLVTARWDEPVDGVSIKLHKGAIIFGGCPVNSSVGGFTTWVSKSSAWIMLSLA